MKKIRDFIQNNLWRKRSEAYDLSKLSAIEFAKWIVENKFYCFVPDEWMRREEKENVFYTTEKLYQLFYNEKD